MAAELTRKDVVIWISYVFMGVAVFYATLFSVLGYRSLGIIGYLVTGVLVASSALMRWGYFGFAKWLLVLCTNGAVFYYANVLGKEAGIQLVFFSLTGASLVIFEWQKERLQAVALIVVASLSYLFCEWFGYPLFEKIHLSGHFLMFIHTTIVCAAVCIFLLPTLFYYKLFFTRESQLQASNTNLQTAYTRLETQQTLLKRRITAIHTMTESCRTLPEWEGICTQIFRHHLNMTPRLWLAAAAQKISVDSEAMNKSELKELLPFDPVQGSFDIEEPWGRALLDATGCFTWNAAGVSVLLPLVSSGATLIGMIGLSPKEPLSTEDLEFAVMVAKELQKTLQLIRSTEAMKTLNMSEFVRKNEAMFRSLNITDRELTIIDLLVQGVSNGEISSQLVVTESTTKRHVYNIFRKLKISNRFELMKWMNERVLEQLGD